MEKHRRTVLVSVRLPEETVRALDAIAHRQLAGAGPLARVTRGSVVAAAVQAGLASLAEQPELFTPRPA